MNAAPQIGELHAVPDYAGMGCTVLALCAVTGRSRRYIQCILRQIGIEDFSSIAPRVWKNALPLLKLNHETIIDDIQAPIHPFMEEHAYRGLLLVVAWDNRDKGHVFAAKGRDFVDIYTYGEIGRNLAPPRGWPDFRVRQIVRVWPR